MKKFTAIFKYVWALALLLPIWVISMVLALLLSVLYSIVTFHWAFVELVAAVGLSLNPFTLWLRAEKEFRDSIREAFKG